MCSSDLGNFGSMMIYLSRLLESDGSTPVSPGTYGDVLGKDATTGKIRELVLNAVDELYAIATLELNTAKEKELKTLASLDLESSQHLLQQAEIEKAYSLGPKEMMHEMVLAYLETDHEPTTAAAMRGGRNIEDILIKVFENRDQYAHLPMTHLEFFREISLAHNRAVASASDR